MSSFIIYTCLIHTFKIKQANRGIQKILNYNARIYFLVPMNNESTLPTIFFLFYYFSFLFTFLFVLSF